MMMPCTIANMSLAVHAVDSQWPAEDRIFHYKGHKGWRRNHVQLSV